jgi:hypothetical protein
MFLGLHIEGFSKEDRGGDKDVGHGNYWDSLYKQLKSIAEDDSTLQNTAMSMMQEMTSVPKMEEMFNCDIMFRD